MSHDEDFTMKSPANDGARTATLKNQRVIMMALEEILLHNDLGTTFALQSLSERIRQTEEYLADVQRRRQERAASGSRLDGYWGR